MPIILEVAVHLFIQQLLIKPLVQKHTQIVQGAHVSVTSQPASLLLEQQVLNLARAQDHLGSHGNFVAEAAPSTH